MAWTSSLCLAFVALFALVSFSEADNSVVCYYDSKSYYRDGQAKMRVSDIDPALSFCTHLIYGYVGINSETFKMISLNENLDLPAGHDNFRTVTALKRRYPALKILLSVGGGSDQEERIKYMTLLETPEARTAFINSAHTLVKSYGFDGLDLAWEFYETKPKKIRGTLGSLWKGFKKIFGTTQIDDKHEEHKEQFTSLVREIKNVFRHDNLLLTASVLPNVNSTVYFDVRNIITNLDQVHLLVFDYYKPERNPEEVDYPAPLYELIDRKPDENGNYVVQYWLSHGAPSNKLILGIPSYGRTWKMTSESAISGVPPFTVDGPGEEGPYTKEVGILSYPEVCTKINSPVTAKGSSAKLRKIGDPSNRHGTYAFRLPDENGDHGIWVGYEDPDTAGNKGGYAKAKALGGVAVVDLSLDDFRGLCTGDKYPILRAAKYRL